MWLGYVFEGLDTKKTLEEYQQLHPLSSDSQLHSKL